MGETATKQRQRETSAQKIFLSTGALTHLLSTQVDVRKGQIQGIILVVPLAEFKDGKMACLKATVPQEMMEELMKRIALLPENKRSAFLQKWIVENQGLIHREYRKSGNSSFKIALHSPTAVSALGMPSRVASKPAKKTPAQKTTPSRTTENRGTRKVAAVGAPAVRGPSGTVQPKKANLSSYIKAGNGTRAKPYEIFHTSEQAEASVDGPMPKQIVRIKITLDMGEHGTYYANAYFSIEQLTKRNYRSTLTKLGTALKSAMRARGIPTGVYAGRINMTIQSMVMQDIQRFQAQKSKTGFYLRTN